MTPREEYLDIAVLMPPGWRFRRGFGDTMVLQRALAAYHPDGSVIWADARPQWDMKKYLNACKDWFRSPTVEPSPEKAPKKRSPRKKRTPPCVAHEFTENYGGTE